MSIFLGKPPTSIEAWIKGHRPTPPTPSVKEKTVFWIDDVEQEPVMIEGALDQQWFIDNGYYDEDEWTWLKNITKAELGSKVTSIGSNAFGGCSSLTSVTIPNSVTSISDGAFGDCSSLTSVTIPNSVTSIGRDAFVSCTSLTSITIPSSVTSIGNSAFQNCYHLTSVNIPSSVTSIDNGAFRYCNDLVIIYVDSESEKERVRGLYAWPETVQFVVKA